MMSMAGRPAAEREPGTLAPPAGPPERSAPPSRRPEEAAPPGRGRAGWRRPRVGGGGGRLYGGRWQAWTAGRGVGKGGDGGRREAVPGEVSGRGPGEATQGGGWR